MADRELVVVIEGKHAGTIIHGSDGAVRLVYDDVYRADPAATPLSVSMPVQLERHPTSRVDPWLWGLLPDNQDVLRQWGREFTVSASSAFRLLATPIGLDCPGAVQLMPTVDDCGDGGVEWITEGQVANEVVELRRDGSAWHGAHALGRFSLAGAQAKTALRLDERKGWGRPHGNEPTNVIIKLSPPGYHDLAINEHLCLATARHLGIPAAKTFVRRLGQEVVLVVERYDRAWRDGAVARVHQEDVCQALSFHPRDKYQSDGGPSVEDVIAMLRRILPPRLAEREVGRFVDALAYNWLIGGTDAHAKNYGLLLAGRQVRMAPLYDVASFLPYEPDPLQLRSAMRISGEYRFKAIRRRSWERLAEDNSLDADQLITRIRHLAHALPDAMHSAVQSMPKEIHRSLAAPLADRIAAWPQRATKAW